MTTARDPNARRRATRADLAKVPEDMTGELVDGELFMSPRPAVRHARAAVALTSQLFAARDRPRAAEPGGTPPEGWHLLAEPELHLGADVMVPDIAGWRRSHLPALPPTPAIHVVPDWVCEVFSPSSYIRDRLAKASAYQRHGVPWIWYVDPSTRFVEVWRNTGKTWELMTQGAADSLFDAPPFEGTELDLGRLWEVGE